jgi:hypothetical protein
MSFDPRFKMESANRDDTFMLGFDDSAPSNKAIASNRGRGFGGPILLD